MEIEEVNVLDPKKNQIIFEYLLPYEKYSLFLLGNLSDRNIQSHYYVAKEKDKIIGVCAYYPLFKSFSLYTEDRDTIKPFVSLIHNNYEINTLLAYGDIGKQALDELLKLGYKTVNASRNQFMELNIKDFKFSHLNEGEIRNIEKNDVDQVVILFRHLHNEDITKPIREDERKKVELSKVKFCLKVDSKVVATAISNGLCVTTFQVLGVVTDPSYRKRGFAKAICSHLIKYMQDNEKAKHAIIFTGYENIAAQKCYSALGFTKTGDYYFAMLKK